MIEAPWIAHPWPPDPGELLRSATDYNGQCADCVGELARAVWRQDGTPCNLRPIGAAEQPALIDAVSTACGRRPRIISGFEVPRPIWAPMSETLPPRQKANRPITGLAPGTVRSRGLARRLRNRNRSAPTRYGRCSWRRPPFAGRAPSAGRYRYRTAQGRWRRSRR